MSDKVRQQEFRKRFKKLFKLGKEGIKGASFDTTYIKSLAKTDEGLEKIKKIYSEVLVPKDRKMMNYLQGKTLEDALDFSISTQKELTKSLEEFVKNSNPENRDMFLISGLGFSPKEVDKFEFSFTEEKPEAVAIPEVQKELMKGVERTKIKMADKVQEKGERKLTVEEMKKITESLVDTALQGAIKDIESITKEKLTKNQLEIIREQLEKETQDKIKKSADEAKAKLLEDEKEMKVEAMTKEDMEKEKKAQEMAKEERPSSGMTKEEEDALLGEEVTEDVKMSISKSKDIEDPKPLGEAIAPQLKTVGTLADFIPPIRLVNKGKSITDLLDDIDFFIKNFPKQLKKESEILGRIDKSKITDVRKLHLRIVGKVRPFVDKKNSKEGEQIGVVVNADNYIREKLKEILQEQTFSNLRPADVVIDVGSKPSTESESKDYGSFEVKSNMMGGLYAQREPVYRYIPSENDPNVGEKDLSRMEKKKAKRLELQKPKSWNQRNTAIRNYKKDPFKSKQKVSRLNYLD